MKRTAHFFLCISLFSISFNISANNVNEFKTVGKPSAIKNVGKLVLAAGKTALAMYAIFAGIAVPLIVLRDTKDIEILSGSFRTFKKYKGSIEPKIDIEYHDINLFPYLGIGVGLASAAHFVIAYHSLKSALKDIQEVFS